MIVQRVCCLVAMLAGLHASAAPTPVAIGMHVVQMRSVDARAESFYADLYLWLRFPLVAEERAKEIIEKLEPVNGEVRWGLSPTLSIPDYTLKRVDRALTESKYPTNFGDPRCTRSL